MAKPEIRMTNQTTNPNDEEETKSQPQARLIIRVSDLIRHSGFVIRISPFRFRRSERL